MHFSKFTSRFTSDAGIVQLMHDLGAAMAGQQDTLMLGGGNPGHIPEVQQFMRERLKRILQEPAEFSHIIGDYTSPQGDPAFIHSLAKLFREQLQWDVGPGNIVMTAGSQAGFFYLFNMFAGEFADGKKRQVLFPMTPEYIGYADVGLDDNLFTANRPEIEKLEEHLFKYRVDFHSLEVSPDIGAMCVSRPTNPTGNVLTDEEIQHLHAIAREHDIPLIIDSAYGMPFPDIVFTDAKSFWADDIILCMSLSKLGLPGTRTGIIIASEEVVEAITQINAVLNLALGNFGPALVQDLVNSGEITTLSRNVIRPFYRDKVRHAVEVLEQHLQGVDYFIHKPEGAIFLWIWFPGLPISSEELYQRLKRRGVLVISGHHFFPGLQEDWQHRHECIRLTYSMQADVVEKGIALIADELKTVYSEYRT